MPIPPTMRAKILKVARASRIFDWALKHLAPLAAWKAAGRMGQALLPHGTTTFLMAVVCNDVRHLRNLWPAAIDNIPSRVREFAFKCAVVRNNYEFVQRLIVDFHVDPATDDNFGVQAAAYNGWINLVKYFAALQARKRINPCGANVDVAVNGNLPFQDAAERGFLSVVEFLWSLPQVRNPMTYDQRAEALKLAAYNGHVDVVAFLCQLGDSYHYTPASITMVSAAKQAIKKGHLNVVKSMCLAAQQPRNYIDLLQYGSELLLSAIEHNRLDIFKFLLAQPSDLADNHADVFLKAVECGRFEMIHLLAADARVNPAASINAALQCCFRTVSGHAVAELLLSLPRILHAMHEYIDQASLRFIVQTIPAQVLQSTRICEILADDILFNGDELLDIAIRRGIVAVFKILYDFVAQRKTPRPDVNKLLGMATSAHAYGIFAFIVQQPGIDPTSIDSRNVKRVIKSGDLNAFRHIMAMPAFVVCERTMQMLVDRINRHKMPKDMREYCIVELNARRGHVNLDTLRVTRRATAALPIELTYVVHLFLYNSTNLDVQRVYAMRVIGAGKRLAM